jgi:NADH:ubiquinone oxidoreductase subunit 2 (subunit N)
LMNKYLAVAPKGLHENLLYILINSVILSLLSKFYYLRLIKMILFDNFNGTYSPTVSIQNVFEITVPLALLTLLGVATVG